MRLCDGRALGVIHILGRGAAPPLPGVPHALHYQLVLVERAGAGLGAAGAAPVAVLQVPNDQSPRPVVYLALSRKESRRGTLTKAGAR